MLNDHFQRKIRAAQIRIIVDALTNNLSGYLALRDLRALLEPREYRRYMAEAQSLEEQSKSARQEDPDLSSDGKAYLDASKKAYELAKKLKPRRTSSKVTKSSNARKLREQTLRQRAVDQAQHASELYEALNEKDKYKFRPPEIEDKLYDRTFDLETELPILKDPLDDNPALKNWQRTAQIQVLHYVIDVLDPRADDMMDGDLVDPAERDYIRRLLKR